MTATASSTATSSSSATATASPAAGSTKIIIEKSEDFSIGDLQNAAAHSLHSHVCALRSMFAHVHAAAKHGYASLPLAGQTLRGFFNTLKKPRRISGVVSLFLQRIGVPIHLAVFDGDYGIEGLEIVPDAAGVDEKRLAPPVHQGAVGMAEKQQVRLFLLRLIPGPEQGLLYPQGVAVAEEDALILDKEETLRLLKGAVIAVAGDLLQGGCPESAFGAAGRPPSSLPDGG